MPRSYTKQDILNCLDKELNTGLLENALCTADSRLSLFADDTRWAIAFEVSGFASPSYDIHIEIHFFGNCLVPENGEQAEAAEHEDGGTQSSIGFGACLRRLFSRGLSRDPAEEMTQTKCITLVDGSALLEIAAEPGSDMLSPSATQVKLRDTLVAIPNRKEAFVRYVPDIMTREFPTSISFEDVGRFLTGEYSEQCRATMQELQECFARNSPPPFIMHINEWHIRSFDSYSSEPIGEKPSSYETFPMIADVLLTGDPNKFQPTLAPTNHWINWPDAEVF